MIDSSICWDWETSKSRHRVAAEVVKLPALPAMLMLRPVCGSAECKNPWHCKAGPKIEVPFRRPRVRPPRSSKFETSLARKIMVEMPRPAWIRYYDWNLWLDAKTIPTRRTRQRLVSDGVPLEAWDQQVDTPIVVPPRTDPRHRAPTTVAGRKLRAWIDPIGYKKAAAIVGCGINSLQAWCHGRPQNAFIRSWLERECKIAPHEWLMEVDHV